LLGVDPGPVVNGSTAAQMATGVAGLLGAEVAVATTGVGGPGPQEGRAEGTVFVAVLTPDGEEVREYHFVGDPAEVVRQATEQALRDLARAVARGGSVPCGDAVDPQSPAGTGTRAFRRMGHGVRTTFTQSSRLCLNSSYACGAWSSGSWWVIT
jgi:hypothetical protein